MKKDWHPDTMQARKEYVGGEGALVRNRRAKTEKKKRNNFFSSVRKA